MFSVRVFSVPLWLPVVGLLTDFSTAGATLAVGAGVAGFFGAVLSLAGLGDGVTTAVSGFAVTGDTGFSTLVAAVPAGLGDSPVPGTVALAGCCRAGAELTADVSTAALSDFAAVLVCAGGFFVAGTVAAASATGELAAGPAAAAFGVEEFAVVTTALAGADACATGSTDAGASVTTGAWLATGALVFSFRSTTALRSSPVLAVAAVA